MTSPILLAQFAFQEYLLSSEQDLGDDGLLVTISGRAVGMGLVLYDEFKRRYENAVTLVRKTTQRLTDRPYTSGQDIRGLTYQTMIEVPPVQNSFSVTLRLLSPQVPSLLLPKPNIVIDEVINGVELIGSVHEEQLREHIKDESYYRHFVRIVKNMAPDGKDVEQVGLASSQRTAALTRTRGEIPPPIEVPVELESEVTITPVDVVGKLAFADDLSGGENAVAIETRDGTSFKIKLTEGIDDLVDYSEPHCQDHRSTKLRWIIGS